MRGVILEACFETVVGESAESEDVFASSAVGSDGVVKVCDRREVLLSEMETEQLCVAWFGWFLGFVRASILHGVE